MKLAFIIPLFNREQFIETAIASLLRQRDSCDLEILVVNDGSTDNGPRLVDALSRDFGCVRMVTTENRGVTRARNTGLQQLVSDCDLVSFLDSDDISPAGRIATDLAKFERDPTLLLTYGRMTLVSEIDDETLEPTASAKQATVRGLSMSAGIYRTSLLQTIGPFDETFAQSEDTDYLFRIFERTRNYLLTDTICVYYRRHSGNMTRDKDVSKRSFMQAIHKMMARRRSDPSLALVSEIFDLKELIENPID